MNAHTDVLKPSIRRMTLDDIKAVMEIEHSSFSLPWSERSYRFDLVKNPNARLWVAEIADDQKNMILAGMIGVWLIIDEVHIGTIAVHPNYRRQGIGRVLLVHALQDASREGAQVCYLEVRKSNLGAQALYNKLGFKTVNVRRHYYHDNGEDALLMTLDDINRL